MSRAPAASIRKVLVVDDNRDLADMQANLVRLCGHEALQAYDGPDALRIADAFKPHVVFLDIVMPGMDGFEVARRLREKDGGDRLKIVAVSGMLHLVPGRGAGFDSYVAKPATASDVFRELVFRN